MEHNDKYNATVVAKQLLTSDLFIMRIKPDNPMAGFVAGQYVLLGLSSNISRREGSDPEFKPTKPDRMVLRAYSIASGGQEPEILEFYISVVSNGSLTPRLVQLNPGDRLLVGEKVRGFFTLETVPSSHEAVVLAATGTGLAPYISILRDSIVKPLPFKLIILHGAPRSWELGYLNELKCFDRFLPNVYYIPSITRSLQDPWWRGDIGRITQYFRHNILHERSGVVLDPNKTSVFLCGNPAMIEEVSQILEPMGYTKHAPQTPGSLHTEEYW